MNNMKTTLSNAPSELYNWIHEQNSNVLLCLCCMLRDIPSLKDQDAFLVALRDALKMYAFCNGNLNGIYCNLVYLLLLEHHVPGYQYLEDLVHGTAHSFTMQEILQNKRDEKILELIEQNKKENRTLIAEHLARTTIRNLWVTQIADDIEFVHNGDRPWTWFYAKHCNDRSTFQIHFSGNFFRKVYEYFQSEEFKCAGFHVVATVY